MSETSSVSGTPAKIDQPRNQTGTANNTPAAAAMAVTAFLAGTLLFAMEAMPTVRGVLQLDQLYFTAGDGMLIYWTVWSMSVLAFLPALVGGMLLTRFIGLRSGVVVFLLLASLGALLTVNDLRVYAMYGRHLVQLFEFVDMPENLELAGGGSSIALEVARVFAMVTTAVVLCYGACYVVCFKLGSRLSSFQKPWIRLFCIVTLSMLVFLPLSVHRYARNYNILERVWIAMPLDMRFDRTEWRRSQLLENPDIAAVDRAIASAYRRHYPRLAVPKPVDTTALVTTSNPPNVVLIVLESLRHDVLEEGWMPRIREWSRDGLVLAKHYSGSFRSEMGMFSLLYGRSEPAFTTTLNAEIKPQSIVSLRASGYRTAYFASHHQQWLRREEFTNDKVFDQAKFFTGEDWTQRDRRTIDSIRTRIESSPDQPVFTVAFLMCTHWEYRYPPAYERHTPVNTTLKWRDMESDFKIGPDLREGLLNRYKNALLFTDDLLADLIESLDPNRNIVVITGDHGESFFDDGTFTHASKLSEAQTRTPMIIVGPGIPVRRIERPTQHADLLPTLMHALNGRPTTIRHCQGRDLLSGQPLPDHTLVSFRSKAILVTPDQRLQFQFSLVAPSAKLDSFVDANANFIDPPVNGEAGRQRLVEAIESELWRISQ